MGTGPRRDESRYRAYLVRLWQEGNDMPWRALARDAETGRECRFATIEQLFMFLHRRTEGMERTGSPDDTDGCGPEGRLEEP